MLLNANLSIFLIINYYISSKKLFLSYWTDVKIADFYVSLCPSKTLLEAIGPPRRLWYEKVHSRWNTHGSVHGASGSVGGHYLYL